MASSSYLSSFLQSLPSSRFSFRINSGISANCNPLLGLLEAKLGNQLELLKLPEEHDAGSESYFSAKWLSRAFGTVLFTNSSAKTFVPDLQVTSSEQGNFFKWLDECLDDNIRLLDACQVIHESITLITTQHSYVKALLSMLSSTDKPTSEATLRRAMHILSKCGKLARKKNMLVSPKRSKLETCGSVLRRMGEKLYNIDDALRGSGWGAMYASHLTTILVCNVLITALSTGPKRSTISTMSISTQGNWLIALSGLQQRIKEQVERKRMKNQKMPYLVELENVDMMLLPLEDFIKQALEAHQFPMAMPVEESMKQTVVELQEFSEELEAGLAQLGQDMYGLYRVLITTRMMLLEIVPKNSEDPGQVMGRLK